MSKTKDDVDETAGNAADPLYRCRAKTVTDGTNRDFVIGIFVVALATTPTTSAYPYYQPP